MDFLKNAVDYCKDLKEVNASTKNIKYVFGADGVYEVRKNELGTFTVKTNKVIGADNVTEGFSFDLPLIPFNMFSQIYSFFKDICDDSSDEVMLQVFFDKRKQEYFLHCPIQTISGTNIVFERDKELYENEDMILVLDIHSHNTMSAFFSSTDDSSEKETRVYGVIGKLNLNTPEIQFRISVGGVFRPLNVYSIFETSTSCNLLSAIFTVPREEYPSDWVNKLTRGRRSFASNYSNWNNNSWGDDYHYTPRNISYELSYSWSDYEDYFSEFNKTVVNPIKNYFIYFGSKSLEDIIDYFGLRFISKLSYTIIIQTTKEQLMAFDPHCSFKEYTSYSEIERSLSEIDNVKEEYDPSKDEYANLSFHERIAKMKEKKDKATEVRNEERQSTEEQIKNNVNGCIENMLSRTRKMLDNSNNKNIHLRVISHDLFKTFGNEISNNDIIKTKTLVNSVLKELYSYKNLENILILLTLRYKEGMYPFYKLVLFDQEEKYNCDNLETFRIKTYDFEDFFGSSDYMEELLDIIDELSYPTELNVLFYYFYKQLMVKGYAECERLQQVFDKIYLGEDRSRSTREDLIKIDISEEYNDGLSINLHHPLNEEKTNAKEKEAYDPEKDKYAHLSFHERIAKMKEDRSNPYYLL